MPVWILIESFIFLQSSRQLILKEIIKDSQEANNYKCNFCKKQNPLPLHHGIRLNLSKTADSGYESDAEIHLQSHRK